MQPSETMQTMASSFPSSTRNHTPQLDNIIFYSGPSSAKVLETIPTKADDWLDIDTILAEAPQQEWAVDTERFDSTGVIDVADEDTQNAIGASTQAATSVPAQAENVSKPLCTDHSQGRAATTRSLEFRASLDVGDTPMESTPARASNTVKLDVQCNGRNIDTTAVDRAADDNASHALWAASCADERLGFNPATNERTSPPQSLTTDVPISPLHTTGSSPCSPIVDTAHRIELKGNHVQPPHLINDHECSSVSPIVLEGLLVEDKKTSETTWDISANAAIAKGLTNDRAHSPGADITNAADPEGSDSDRPLTRRRPRTRPDTHYSSSPSPPLTPQSSARSDRKESTTAPRQRKRLRRRNDMQRSSLIPETIGTSPTSATSIPSRAGCVRWPIQCFANRKIIGSQEVIVLELPALELCAGTSPVPTLLPSDDPSQTALGWCATRKSGKKPRRCRFTRKEEELLVELKGRREPKLSWRDIQRHFPNRSIGSLQVHYSTHLKG